MAAAVRNRWGDTSTPIVSWDRACAALVLGNKPGVHPERIIKTWGDDAMATAILKVAQSPTSTATYPQLQATAVLPMLAPAKSRTVDDRPMR